MGHKPEVLRGKKRDSTPEAAPRDPALEETPSTSFPMTTFTISNPFYNLNASMQLHLGCEEDKLRGEYVKQHGEKTWTC